MNRTPRSASRRASRQLEANEPSAPSTPYSVEHVRRLVGDVHQLRHARLHAEGQFVLRDARGDLGIVDDVVAHARSSAATASTTSPLLVRRHARRVADVVHRVAGRVELARPDERLGRKPLCHCRDGDRLRIAAAACWSSTTKPGRLLASLPRPYVIHEPMLGRPEIDVPVFMKVWAGSWLICSVCIERTMQMSSAIAADVRQIVR